MKSLTHPRKINTLTNQKIGVDQRIISNAYKSSGEKLVSVPDKKCYFVYIKPVILDTLDIHSGTNTI